MIPIREIEFAFAAEAARHAEAARALNPFGEAEALELGDARAVYAGQWSPVHGVFGLGLDGPVEERDLREIERFFQRLERAPAFWICPATDPSLLVALGRDYVARKTRPVHGAALSAAVELPPGQGSSAPAHETWSLAFTRALDSAAQAPGLLALTKLHQKETRFYLGKEDSASYTFFHRGIALVPEPAAALVPLQWEEAKNFRAQFFAAGGACPLPKLFERTLYERI